MKLIFVILCTTCLFFSARSQSQAAMQFSKTKTVSIAAAYDYLLFTPSNMELQENGKSPLIIFLHGAGERGDDIDLVKVHGPPKIVEANKDFPFYVLSPQCASDSWWEAEQLVMLMDEVISMNDIDETRIYLTGLSMGGYATWDLAQLRPDRFAAIAPICGGSRMNAFRATLIKNVATWAFHGAMDTVVPLEASTRIVKALKNVGGDVKFTIYPMAGHDSWTETYANPKLYEWFLAHRLK